MLKNAILMFALVMATCGCEKKRASHGEATLDDLNQVLATMSIGSGHPPASINDLTNFPTLRGKTLPVPPAGMKLAIDPTTRIVRFMPQ